MGMLAVTSWEGLASGGVSSLFDSRFFPSLFSPPHATMNYHHLFFLAALLTLVAAQDPAQFVNPFIGTEKGGHVFPGATLPWGSAKPGADSKSGDNQAGFVSDGSPIFGISQL
jgi:hypothetical protein